VPAVSLRNANMRENRLASWLGFAGEGRASREVSAGSVVHEEQGCQCRALKTLNSSQLCEFAAIGLVLVFLGDPNIQRLQRSPRCQAKNSVGCQSAASLQNVRICTKLIAKCVAF
jgi:hypothetical protein